MRVSFTSVPAHGHVLPLLPLARAARDAGDDVSFATGADFENIVEPLRFIPVGPSLQEIFAESDRRIPDRAPGSGMHVAGAADFFGPTRIDLTLPDLRERLAPAPDLLVADRDDMAGPLFAAELGVPWVRVHFSPAFPAEVTEAIEHAARVRAESLGIEPTSPVAEIDCWPEVLQPDGWRQDRTRITMSAEAYRAEGGAGATAPAIADIGRRILVTTGTMVDDPEVVRGFTSALVDLDVDVWLTGRQGADWPLEDLSPRVQQVGFRPLSELLAGSDVAVVAGGAGTVAGALAQETPLVILPQVYDQFAIAELAAARGAAVVVSSPDALAGAVRRVLDDRAYAHAASTVARTIAAMGTPGQAWVQVRERLP